MSDTIEQKEPPKWLVTVQKVTSLSGESIQVSTNLPKSASKEDLLDSILEVCWALDERLVQQNEKVLAITAATREALNGLTTEVV
jgi:hypothetical protein